MSTTVLVLIVIAVVVIGVVVWAAARARAARDGVDSFRRQIDALSPEARRTVIDQVHNAAERREQSDTDDEDDDEDEDGPRGT